uniref:X-Pro dipeptidyl-peptidase domain-containing protein n=1 Tax=uncultured marine group II/III euryarchaeote AD1000_105_G07 TaxID=1457714 RepID=A0A075FIT7_9EURY|nr:X-Pro dipeptidyl-peptidase domain-containing protein [uncultured marine group II/III euryarchaeote AD1000_105_G07]
MAKHRAGDKRILSISMPEKLAKRLDRHIGRGRENNRSATISRLVELAALHRPPHLTALWPDVTRIRGYEVMARPGGALLMSVLGACILHAHDMPEIKDDTAAKKRIEHAAENLRELIWLTPFKRGHTALSVTPTMEETFFNYYHRSTIDDWWRQENLTQSICMERHSDIPVTITGGWFDSNVMDAVLQHSMLQEQSASKQRIIIGPWNHYSMKGKGTTYLTDLDFGPSAHWGDLIYNQERLRWFDKWLKDLDTGVEKDPPVRIFVMGGGSGCKTKAGHLDHGGTWRNENEWPLTRAVQTIYRLGGNGELSTAPATDARSNQSHSVSWTHDPDHPVPTLGGAVTGFYEWVKLPEGLNKEYVTPRARMRQLMPAGPMHQREQAGLVGCQSPYPLLAERADVMVFQTPQLETEIEVTGPIEVVLWVSSSAPDTDFTAKLVDVYPPNNDYPEGYHVGLTDSILRARFRNGFDREDLMDSGDIYEITIKLPPTSNLFKAGNRIRLDIASSNFPRFEINPNTGEPLGRHTGSVKALNTVYFDNSHPSQLILPVIPN